MSQNYPGTPDFSAPGSRSQQPQQPGPYEPPYAQPAPAPYSASDYPSNPYESYGGPVFPADQPRAKTVGLIALLMAVAALLVSIGLDVASVPPVGTIMRETGSSSIDSESVPAHLQDEMAKFAGLMMAQIIPSLLGIAALIMGIVATAQRRGRGYGIGAIITSLAAPIISFTVFVIMLMPYVRTS